MLILIFYLYGVEQRVDILKESVRSRATTVKYSYLLQTALNSKAPATSRKYLYAIERWRRWADGKDEISSFPVMDWQLALYLRHIANTIESISAVEEAVNAISWLHEVSCIPPISETKEGPVTVEMLIRMVDAATIPVTLSDSRIMAMSILAFSGFLRFDELAKLRCCDVMFHEDHLELRILSSKTDQYRDGASVVIAGAGMSKICPMARLRQYINLANIDITSTERLFRAITRSSNGERLRQSGTISYTRIREIVLGKFRQLGYDASKFGLHSFRSGGASLAANAGVPDRLFKRHGRWRSENAKDGYIKDSLESS